METKSLRGIDELDGLVGQSLGESDWHVITQEMIDRFAEATGDHQWIHVDPKRAADGPFGGTIAHGFLTLSLVPVILQETVHIDGISMLVNYGCNRVRFPAPVPVGSRLRGSVKLGSVERNAKGAQAVFHVTIAAEGIEKPVCSAEFVSLLFA